MQRIATEVRAHGCRRPGLLAPDVLDRADVRAALAEHDFAASFTLFKKWGGLSQNRIASACRLTPGKVSTIISGSQRVTSFDVVCRIADGLRIPGGLLGLAPRPWEGTPTAPHPPEAPGVRPDADEIPWRPDATVDLATHLTRSDLVMDRRALTRALAGAAVTGAALLDSLEGWLVPAATVTGRRRPGRLGIREVEELETTARAFRQWDHQYGGGLRRKAVLGQLAEVSGALDDHQASAVADRLYRVMAQLAGTAATMAWDSGLHRRAQDYYRLALRAAHAGGDVVFGANVLAGMARQMLYRDRADDALQLIHLAQEGARDVIGPRVRAMLHTREAWAYAAQGRTAGFQRATAKAAEDLAAAGADDEPYWIAYFDEAELAGVTGGGFWTSPAPTRAATPSRPRTGSVPLWRPAVPKRDAPTHSTASASPNAPSSPETSRELPPKLPWRCKPHGAHSRGVSVHSWGSCTRTPWDTAPRVRCARRAIVSATCCRAEEPGA
ncbi:helix-turn-helix domain-containing protein [Streptomyces griseus]|uniref:helix-turn-helix domain-containing protein n=1 Tax=Streptomyces griseus TaxID=1911 RepID=UPI0036A084CD